jgi:hypothetical protein
MSPHRRKFAQAGVTVGLAPALAIAVALILTGCSAPAAHPGPTASPAAKVGTLYTPPASAPAPGALYARAVLLKSGAMLATFEQYTAGKPVFPIYRSTDHGITWRKYSRIADTQNGWGLRYQPFLYQLPTALGNLPAGTILAAGNSIPSDLSKTRLDLYESPDQGMTWKFVSLIASGGRAIPNNGETPVWEPFLLENAGMLIVFYSDQRDPGHGQILDHETTADGIHWSTPVDDVVAPNADARPGMPTVAHLGNGQWAMTYEYGGAPEGDFAAYIKLAASPLLFGAATGHVIMDQHGIVGHSSPWVIWAPIGKTGELVVSTGDNPLLFVNTHDGAADAWTTIASNVPQGYSRSFVVMPDGHHLFGISGGAIGATHNTVTFATDDLAAK